VLRTETPEEFLNKPWKDRQSVYRDVLTHFGPVYLKDMILWDKDRHWTWEDDTALLPQGVPLLDLRLTENARLTQEAREFFYQENLIVAGFNVPWLSWGPEEGEFDPSLWLRRVQVVIHDEGYESTQVWLLKTYEIFVSAVHQLMECDRLEYVVLEVRGSKSEHVSALESLVAQEVDVLRELDERTELGVLMVRECAWDPWGRCTQSQALQFPWWDDEKTARMRELEDEWRGDTGVQRSPLGSWETVEKIKISGPWLHSTRQI
jgi:hypothetical protein